MKITFINRMMGIYRGGGEFFDLNLAKALHKKGCEITFITGRRFFKIDHPVMEFPTRYIRSPYLRWLDYKYMSSSLRPLRSIGGRSNILDRRIFENMSFRKVAKDKVFDVDVIQICGFPRLASLINCGLNVPTVIRWPGPPSSWTEKWFGTYTANIANGAALDRARELDPNSLDVPPGVDRNMFNPGRASHIRSKYNISETSTVLLFVGRLIPIKNIEFLISSFSDALKLVPDMYLILVGSGEQETQLKNLVGGIGISNKVLFVGNQPQSSVANFYKASDIFALTSRYDNFPNVILESMSSGLPIVATNVGGIHYQIKDGLNGFLVDPSNKNEYTEAIVTLATNSALRSRMGEENIKSIESTFSWDSSAEKVLGLYEAIKHSS